MKLQRNKQSSNRKRFLPIALLVVIVAGIGFSAQRNSSAGASTAQLYLSPASQSVTKGSTITVNVLVNTSSNSINWAQSVMSYSSSLLTYDSLTVNSNLFSATTPVVSTGSAEFGYSAIAGSSVNGTQTVATATFTATAAGTAKVSLASVCPAGSYALTCSAVYDSTTSNNDLASVAGASYTITTPVVVTPPPTPTPTPTPNPVVPTPPKTPTAKTPTTSTPSPTVVHGQPVTSSGSSKSSSGTTSSSGSTSTTTTPTASTAAVAAPGAPLISDVSIANITNTSAILTWQTDVASSSVVTYGLTPELGLSAQNGTAVTSHSVTLSGLATGVSYYYDVGSAVGSAASTSAQQNFNTLGFGVTLKIVDKNGKPIANALVTIGSQSTKTDSNGNAKLSNVPSGTQTLVVKSGSKVTKRQLVVGKVNPATGVYEAQSFSLTAVRGKSYTALYALIALVAVIVCLPTFGRPYLSKIMQRRWGLAPQPIGMNTPVYTPNNPAPNTTRFNTPPSSVSNSGQTDTTGYNQPPEVKATEINSHLSNLHNTSVPMPGASITPVNDEPEDKHL